MEPTVSVIIPALNAASVLPEQLEAMARQELDIEWEVIVVDNGSDDATADLARSFANRLRIRLVSEPRRGTNFARNAGIAAATTDKLLFTDADDIVGPRWVGAMAEALEPNSIVGGWLDRRHLPPDPPRTLEPAPISGIFRGEWLPYPIGCCMGWDRELLESVGTFDTEIPYGGDEVEVIWRAQLAGGRVLQAEPDAVLIRRERADPAALRRQAVMFGKAEARMARQFAPHGHPGKVLSRSPWRAAKSGARLFATWGPRRLEEQRRFHYHLAAAVQSLRYRLRIDSVPS